MTACPPDFRLRAEQLVNNPTNRAPIVLCLDCSGSMAGDPIAELNAGVRAFVRQVSAHRIAKASAELCVVTFADQPLALADFQTVEHLGRMPPLVAGGLTDLGGGVAMALDRLTARTAEYQRAAVQFYKPWLVVMTDGVPTTDRHPAAAARCRELEKSGKLNVFTIGTGPAADLSVLAAFSDRRRPMRMKDRQFQSCFEWFSAQIVRVSQSQPGDVVTLDAKGLEGWATL